MKSTKMESSYSQLLVYVLIGFVLVAWAGTVFLVPYFYGKPDGAGTFGDMFGSVNALFSGLAFVGVIIAILLQKDELSLQRRELQDTREELRGQKMQLEEQNKTLRKQYFEGTFFQLLKLYNDIVNSLDIDSQSNIISRWINKDRQQKPPSVGRDAFVTMYAVFREMAIDAIIKERKINRSSAIDDIISNAYSEFYQNNQSDLGHYFRTIYNLVKFIDTSDIENKKFYTDILRAQLSSHELLLLHYNSISNYGKDKMLPYISKYNLTKHLPVSLKVESILIAREERRRIDAEKAKGAT